VFDGRDGQGHAPLLVPHFVNEGRTEESHLCRRGPWFASSWGCWQRSPKKRRGTPCNRRRPKWLGWRSANRGPSPRYYASVKLLDGTWRAYPTHARDKATADRIAAEMQQRADKGLPPSM
jgi:hypothetical protein